MCFTDSISNDVIFSLFSLPCSRMSPDRLSIHAMVLLVGVHLKKEDATSIRLIMIFFFVVEAVCVEMTICIGPTLF